MIFQKADINMAVTTRVENGMFAKGIFIFFTNYLIFVKPVHS